jgi:hypothetical protein
MRQRFFLLALLIAIAAVSAALAPLSIALALRNHAGAHGLRVMTQTRRRLAAAGARLARRIRAASA